MRATSITEKPSAARSTATRSAVADASWTGVDKGLFERLRELLGIERWQVHYLALPEHAPEGTIEALLPMLFGPVDLGKVGGAAQIPPADLSHLTAGEGS